MVGAAEPAQRCQIGAVSQAFIFALCAHVGIVVVADVVTLFGEFPGQTVARFTESFTLLDGVMAVVVFIFAVAASWSEECRRSDEDEPDGRSLATTAL